MNFVLMPLFRFKASLNSGVPYSPGSPKLLSSILPIWFFLEKRLSWKKFLIFYREKLCWPKNFGETGDMKQTRLPVGYGLGILCWNKAWRKHIAREVILAEWLAQNHYEEMRELLELLLECLSTKRESKTCSTFNIKILQKMKTTGGLWVDAASRLFIFKKNGC